MAIPTRLPRPTTTALEATQHLPRQRTRQPFDRQVIFKVIERHRLLRVRATPLRFVPRVPATEVRPDLLT